MNIENIVFLENDTLKDTLTKTVLIWAGTTELKKQLKLHGVTNYTKVIKGVNTYYILRGANINGKIEVKL